MKLNPIFSFLLVLLASLPLWADMNLPFPNLSDTERKILMEEEVVPTLGSGSHSAEKSPPAATEDRVNLPHRPPLEKQSETTTAEGQANVEDMFSKVFESIGKDNWKEAYTGLLSILKIPELELSWRQKSLFWLGIVLKKQGKREESNRTFSEFLKTLSQDSSDTFLFQEALARYEMIQNFMELNEWGLATRECKNFLSKERLKNSTFYSEVERISRRLDY